MPVIKALVAARAGSLRVPNKNTRPFAGTSLIQNKLLQLLRLPILDGVVVSSDDPRVLEIARCLGCEPILRDAYFASDEVSMTEVYEHMATQCQADVIVYANCTNPLVRDTTVESLIKDFEQPQREFDSINSATKVAEFMFHENLPINYDLRRQPRSQDLPEIVALNFAVNVLERATMIARGNVVGLDPLLRVIDEVEAVDIDTELDFFVAEQIYLHKGGGGYLKS